MIIIKFAIRLGGQRYYAFESDVQTRLTSLLALHWCFSLIDAIKECILINALRLEDGVNGELLAALDASTFPVLGSLALEALSQEV